MPWPYSGVNAYPLRLVAVSAGELWGVGNIGHQEGCAPARFTEIMQGVFFHEQQGTWSEQVLP